jgi:hypothetical protein
MQRGAYDKPGEKVEPNVPAIFPPLRLASSSGAVVPLGSDTPGNAKPAPAPRPKRLDLALWLVAPENPLTSRVTVNRFWQQFFGTGLVATPDDFGSQGQPPSHPELLDWLASYFQATGWDVKNLVRLMVTSATYRQSSKVTPEMIARDPANRLLARAPRIRLPGEIVRDAARRASKIEREAAVGKARAIFRDQLALIGGVGLRGEFVARLARVVRSGDRLGEAQEILLQPLRLRARVLPGLRFEEDRLLLAGFGDEEIEQRARHMRIESDALGVFADGGDALVLDLRAIHDAPGALFLLRDEMGHVHAALHEIHDEAVDLPQVFAELNQIRHGASSRMAWLEPGLVWPGPPLPLYSWKRRRARDAQPKTGKRRRP